MKQFTIILGSPPYSGQDVDTVLGIAEAALNKGHGMTVVGSGDGTYGFLKGHGHRSTECREGVCRSHCKGCPG
jgi:sulfur relay (sulfurtransferase) complex TusBCD TusD component (DsrE family)